MAEIAQVNLDVNFQPAAAGPNQAPTLAPIRDALGVVNETAPATDTAPGGLNGRLQRVSQRLTALIALVPATLGTKAAAAAFGVALATEDVARLGATTEIAPANDTAAAGLNGRLQRIAQNLTTYLPATLGSKAAAASLAITASAEDIARVGAINETAPANDTAPVGLNGRLQRIAQNLTALVVSAATELPAGKQNIGHVGGTEYEAVAASASNQALGTTGAVGDFLGQLTVTPLTTTAGAITIKDGANAAISVFAGGTLASLIPFHILIGAKSTSGAWQISTGTNVSLIAFGDFT